MRAGAAMATAGRGLEEGWQRVGRAESVQGTRWVIHARSCHTEGHLAAGGVGVETCGGICLRDLCPMALPRRLAHSRYTWTRIQHCQYPPSRRRSRPTRWSGRGSLQHSTVALLQTGLALLARSAKRALVGCGWRGRPITATECHTHAALLSCSRPRTPAIRALPGAAGRRRQLATGHGRVHDGEQDASSFPKRHEPQRRAPAYRRRLGGCQHEAGDGHRWLASSWPPAELGLVLPSPGPCIRQSSCWRSPAW